MLDALTPEPSRLPVPQRERWIPLRAGLQNVWEYDERRFVFERGRLLLRGRNEAGKTKALELLFPFLLDADLSPQRLDPFGSAARPMRWNLLNENNPDDQQRVGYLWLELGRLVNGAPEYLVLGAGLKARRSTGDVDAWFFVTSQRPDVELGFFGEGRRPLGKGELGEVIGACGQVFERHADYRRAVNARLFGMPDEQYVALVGTLLHLRRPQLSKTLEVAELSAFLSASLPPLDPAVIAPIAEGFERLDHRRADLESLERVAATLRAFEAVYREYAGAVAKEKAQALTRADSVYQKARAEARQRAEEHERLLALRGELEAEVRRLGEEETLAAARVRALEASDAYRAARDLDEADAAARAAEERSAEVASRSGADVCERAKAAERVGTAGGETAARREELALARREATARAGEAALAGPHAVLDRLCEALEVKAAGAALETVVHEREEALAVLRKLGRELASADEAHRRAEERARERGVERDAAREALQGAERDATAARERFADEAEAWLASLAVLPRDALAGVEPAGLRGAAELAAAPLRDALSADRAAALSRSEELSQQRRMTEAERDALARAPHPVPSPPAWRAPRQEERPGAPLYLLCDFGEGARGSEARLEAALEASGLLDAWVEPDGTVLDPLTQDAVLRAAPAGGGTLADVFQPVAAGGVSIEAARRALAAVGYAGEGEEPEGSTWVSADGRFRLGALRGAHVKERSAYVGATAREAERARRLALLEERLAALGEALAAVDARAAAAAGRLSALSRELAALPDGRALDEATARVVVRAEALGAARLALAAAERAAAEAAAARSAAAAALDAAAVERGLAAFARDAEGLAARTRDYQVTAARLLAAADALARARAALVREEEALREAEVRGERSEVEAGRAHEEAATSRARAEALREASGAAAEEVVRGIASARAGARTAREGQASARERQNAVVQQVGRAEEVAAAADQAVVARDDERQRAAEELRAIAANGVLTVAGLETDGGPEGWTYTAALEAARRVDAAIARGGTAEERERAEDRLLHKQSDLQAQLPPDVRILPSRPHGVLAYAFSLGGHSRPAREALAELEGQISARQALLGEDERRLIEEFLSGEAHDHLAGRLREARALVDRMNAALEGRSTAAGAQVRLSWEVDDEHGGARAAVALFLHAGHLLSEANREALRLFLQERLTRARDAEGTKPLQERMLEALDYRPWHRFVVQHRTPGQAWAPLTRKAHAAGSGGKKAVMLHLPLFAAAAAFYDAARPGAPRLIALDEAFAGIDRPMRGQLMGLLAEFDLDFVMTSYEEWGFYEELDGLSTYHLSRDPGVRGVHAEWFVWNGREQLLVEEG